MSADVSTLLAAGEQATMGRRGAASAAPRVLIIPPSYDATDRILGGGERYALEYARAMARLTPTTLLLFGRRSDDHGADGLRVRTVRTGEVERRLVRISREFHEILNESDVVHSMVFPKPVTDRLLLWARVRRRPIVLTDVGGGGPSLSGGLRRLNARLDPNRMASGLALLSQHSARQFVDWRIPKTVLYGGVRTEGAPRPLPETPYALFVGRLLPHKGVLELIEAVGKELPLRVVGRPYDVNYLAKLKERAGSNVSFFLDAPDEAMAEHMAGAGVIVQPSRPVGSDFDYSELLGLSALEGMAAGRPAIVSTAGSLSELVEEGLSGFVVKEGDVGSLRDAIRTILSDRELAARMGAAARQRAVERYSWEAAAVRGLDFYRSLSAPRRRLHA